MAAGGDNGCGAVESIFRMPLSSGVSSCALYARSDDEEYPDFGSEDDVGTGGFSSTDREASAALRDDKQMVRVSLRETGD